MFHFLSWKSKNQVKIQVVYPRLSDKGDTPVNIFRGVDSVDTFQQVVIKALSAERYPVDPVRPAEYQFFSVECTGITLDCFFYDLTGPGSMDKGIP
jgi:hypothetical protein